MSGWPSVGEMAEAAERAPADSRASSAQLSPPSLGEHRAAPLGSAPRAGPHTAGPAAGASWGGGARADVNLAIGHALGLLVAHAVHAARLSAANMRHTLRTGPGGGAALGAGGAASDAALLWAVLQARPAGRCGGRIVTYVQRVCALRAAGRRRRLRAAARGPRAAAGPGLCFRQAQALLRRPGRAFLAGACRCLHACRVTLVAQRRCWQRR